MIKADHRYLRGVMPLPEVLRAASGIDVDVDQDVDVVEVRSEPSLRMELCLGHAIAVRTSQILRARPRCKLLPGFAEQAFLGAAE